MKTWIKALGIAGLLTSAVALADAVIFSGNDVKTLKPNIDLYGQGKILSGSVDPTSVATSAPVGSIYLNTSNGNLYRKVDAGSSTNWQKVGSAAVAGNLLPNPDWETSSSGWTASAGTYARTTTAANVGFGAGSGSWDASASSQTLTSTAVAIPTGLYAANGLARCYFKTTATDYVLQAYDGTNVLASATIPASTQYQQYGVNFPFPSSGSVSLRVVSASDAAVIYMDDCYVGPAANLQQVNQAQVYGSVLLTGVASVGVTSTYSAFSAAMTATASGNATQEAGLVPPRIKFATLPPGTYKITANGCGIYDNAHNSSVRMDIAIGDGTSYYSAMEVFSTDAGTNAVPSALSGTFTISSAQSNVTIQLYGRDRSSLSGINLDCTSQGVSGLNISVLRFPSTSELAYRPDQVAWRVDANISGANPALSSSSQSSYIEITDASLALAQNSGSIATQIACASGTASSGTTCTAANESIGIAFTAPAAGDVLACASFSTETFVGGGSATNLATFQIVETTNTSSAIIQEGKTRTNIGYGNGLITGGFYMNDAVRICGNFTFSSSGQKTLRLEYELLNNTGQSITIRADAGTGVGQRDIHWEVYPITQAIPAPLLVGSVTSNSSGLERVERARFVCTTGSTITSQSGNWISSVGNLSSGSCAVNFQPGIFSAAPSCFTSQVAGGFGVTVPFPAATTSGVTSNCFVSQTGAACTGTYTVDLLCMGPR